MRLGNLHVIPVGAESNDLGLRGTAANFGWWQVQLQERERRRLAFREYASNRNINLEFEARVRLLPEGGSGRAGDDALVFEYCDRLPFLLAADTNYLNRRNQG